MTNVYCPHMDRCNAYRYNACNGCSHLGTYKFEVDTVPEIDRNMIKRYVDVDDASTLSLYNTFKNKKEPKYPGINKVTISGPCTIIFWEDGTKTVMKCSKKEEWYDPEKAILLAFYRKVTGFSKTHAQNELDKLMVKAHFNGIDEFAKEN